MKRRLQIVLTALVMMLPLWKGFVMQANAPSLSKGGRITLTTANEVGKRIEFHIKAESDITITGVNEPAHKDYGVYTIKSQTVVIEGSVTFFACNGQAITSIDLTQCPTLTELQLSGNLFTKLDLSQNKNLKKAMFYQGKHEQLILGELPNLTELVCHANALTKLDLRGVKKLIKLWCYQNPNIKELEVSHLVELRDFCCDNTGISKLNLNSNNKLTKLICNQNPLGTLDVTQCPELSYLSCALCGLTNLDVTKNLKLTELIVFENRLDNIDITKLSKLKQLVLYGNRIDLQTMHAIVMALPTYDKKSYTKGQLVPMSLIPEKEKNHCSKVTVDLAKSKGWSVYAQTENSFVPYEGSDEELDSDIPNDGSSYLVLYSNKTKGEVIRINFQAVSAVTIRGADAKLIDNNNIDITLRQDKVVVIGDFLAFAAQNVGLTKLKLKQPLLINLWVDRNRLTEIDFSKAKAIQILNVSENNFETLNIDFLTNLDVLYCNNNKLKQLSTYWNQRLAKLYCQNNQLEALNLSRTPSISLVYMYNNQHKPWQGWRFL